MISKSTIAAMVLVTTGLASGFASPAFAQVPPAYYYGYAGPYAYPHGPPAPFDYGYGGWPPGSAAALNYNIHTPPNH